MTRAEAIREARRKEAAGEFNFAITKTTPVTLQWDEVELECGHRTLISPLLEQLFEEVETSTKRNRQYCDDCAKAWIATNSGGK